MTTAGLHCDDQARRAASRKQKYLTKTTKYGQKTCRTAWNWTQCHAGQILLRILKVLQVGSMLDSE